MGEIRLTVAQALVKFLSAQYSESDSEEQRLFAGCFGIFGHGNVAGIGQALLQAELEEPDSLRYKNVTTFAIEVPKGGLGPLGIGPGSSVRLGGTPCP